MAHLLKTQKERRTGSAAAMWARKTWEGQPVDALILDAPVHDGTPEAIAREIYHRLLARLASVGAWQRQKRVALLGAACGLLSFSLPSLPGVWSEILGIAVMIGVAVAGFRFIPRLMEGVITPENQAEAAGVVRRAMLREIPDGTPADLADVWRQDWLTAEGLPLAAELTEADARYTSAERVAMLWMIALLAGGAGIASLLGGYLPAVVAIVIWGAMLVLIPHPLLERRAELEAQEAVEGAAYVAAGGAPWAARQTQARGDQLAIAARDESPFIALGTSTGLLAARGDGYGPNAGRSFGLSLTDLQQHLVVFGGTGSGKTSGVLRPIAVQAAKWKHVGLVIMDGKGALPGELSRLPGLTVIDPATHKISLVAGLDPVTIVDTIANILGGAGDKEDNFFVQSASGLLRRAAVLAQALGPDHWTLSRIAALAFQQDERDKALTALKGAADEVRYDPVVVEAREYFTSEFANLDAKTKSNIEASARAWITTITAHGQLLAWADARPSDEKGDLVMSPLRGGKIGILVPAHRYGNAGAVVSALLKARLYAGLKARAEQTERPAGETDVLFLVDEAQEVATKDDTTMLAIGRSLGLAVVAATQTIEGVVAKLGEHTGSKWLTIFGSALTLSGRSPATDAFMAHRTGTTWRLTVEAIKGLPVRMAVAANVATGISAACRHQASLIEALDIPGADLAETAWTRATQPVTAILKTIMGGKDSGAAFETKLGPRPVIEAGELQTLLAEPDTALVLTTRGRVPRRDIIQLAPIYGNMRGKDGTDHGAAWAKLPE